MVLWSKTTINVYILWIDTITEKKIDIMKIWKNQTLIIILYTKFAQKKKNMHCNIIWKKKLLIITFPFNLLHLCLFPRYPNRHMFLKPWLFPRRLLAAYAFYTRKPRMFLKLLIFSAVRPGRLHNLQAKTIPYLPIHQFIVQCAYAAMLFCTGMSPNHTIATRKQPWYQPGTSLVPA